MRNVNSGNTFVVGGESNGDAEFAIDGERMIFPGDTEDRVVASEIDFDHARLLRHSTERR